jgi:hypothetical protein
MRWKDDPARAQLLSLYARADELVAGATCACSPGAREAREAREGESPPPDAAEAVPCCHFGVTGREPYPTAVELLEVFHAIRARGARPAAKEARRSLPVADASRRCPLLSDDRRCTIYASRPLGCRSFFCDRGDGPPRGARAGLLEVARRIADLSSKVAPRDPGPRPLVRAIKGHT